MDAHLVFECLMYINVYYYFMFAIANFAIWIAKNTSQEYDTPYIFRDAYVAASLTISELLKLLLFRRFRKQYEGWSVLLSIFFAVLSVFALLYVFFIQDPVLRLEYCMDAMLFVLLVGEILYGIYSFLPCCTAKEL